MVKHTCNFCENYIPSIPSKHTIENCSFRMSVKCLKCCMAGHLTSECSMQITWTRPQYLEDLISDEDKKRWQITTQTPILHSPLTSTNYTETALREISGLNKRTATSRELLKAINEYDMNQKEYRKLIKEKKETNKFTIDMIYKALDTLRTQITKLTEESGTINVPNDDKKIRSFMDAVNVKTVHEQIENMRILTEWAIQQSKRIEFVKETAATNNTNVG